MNAKDCATELGISERTVRRAIADGHLPAQKVSGYWQVNLDDARAVFRVRRSQHWVYKDALAESLRLLRAFGHEADALAVEQDFGLVYTEARATVQVA